MKIIIYVLCSLLALTQGDIQSRVVNGENVKLGERPFQVSLQASSHFCGGSIANEYWIITAAHCVSGRSGSSINVIVGTINLKKPYKSHRSEQIIIHERYASSDSHRNDIALIKLAEPITFSDRVKPVELPKPYTKVKTNSSAVLSGWGGTVNTWSPTPDDLQKATIFIADPEYCNKIMKEKRMTIYPTHICANDPSIRRGQCNGDSGGPLTVDNKLTGIVSWSIKDPDCASTKYPGVYTRVSEFVDWIYKYIN
ncbi:mite allergen Eur m 3-like isoform X2 [Phymastichus coffea]|uniref:mite allergen Eur m 3-like isoform X2 n=1 Tax=Phymastichus coffea TaxID=108790 RepID=UPI00273AC194|nr:mite allergen Eur m 3-like isoform X2 [Phymastichus coffea]